MVLILESFRQTVYLLQFFYSLPFELRPFQDRLAANFHCQARSAFYSDYFSFSETASLFPITRVEDCSAVAVFYDLRKLLLRQHIDQAQPGLVVVYECIALTQT